MLYYIDKCYIFYTILHLYTFKDSALYLYPLKLILYEAYLCFQGQTSHPRIPSPLKFVDISSVYPSAD